MKKLSLVFVALISLTLASCSDGEDDVVRFEAGDEGVEVAEDVSPEELIEEEGGEVETSEEVETEIAEEAIEEEVNENAEEAIEEETSETIEAEQSEQGEEAKEVVSKEAIEEENEEVNEDEEEAASQENEEEVKQSEEENMTENEAETIDIISPRSTEEGALTISSFDGKSHETKLNYNVIRGNTSKETYSITVNDYKLQKYYPGQTEWSYIAGTKYKTLEEGNNKYVVKAFDKDGNEIDTATFSITYETMNGHELPQVGLNLGIILLTLSMGIGYTLTRRKKEA